MQYVRKGTRELVGCQVDPAGDRVGLPLCARHRDGCADTREDCGVEGRDTEEPPGDQRNTDEAQGQEHLDGWDCDDAGQEESFGGGEESGVFQLQKRLHASIQEAIHAALPRNDSELTAHLFETGNGHLVLHPDFPRSSRILMDGHKQRFLKWPWERILSETPPGFHDSTDYLNVTESIAWFYKVMAHNKIEPKVFIHDVCAVVNRQYPKKNCVMIFGPANAGKTLICESIVNSTIYFETLSMFSGTSNFEFQPMQNMRAVLFNEPSVTDKTVEMMKNILEGIPVTIEVKYAKGQSLPRTPVFITGNGNFLQYTSKREQHKDAFKARTFYYSFVPFDDLRKCHGKLHPLMWDTLIRELDKEE